MGIDTTRRWQIAASLTSKEARDEFVAARIRVRVPAQIREMRLGRKWSQADLGTKADMKQSAISRCEGMGYDQFTLSTLKALAAAFDVGLKVEFVPFSELIHNAANPEIYGLDVPSYALDMQFELHAETSFSVEDFNEDLLTTHASGTFGEIQGTKVLAVQTPSSGEAMGHA